MINGLKSKNFPNFLNYLLDTIGLRPGDNYHLDRIDGTKGYMPGNIQWLIASENSRKRLNLKLTQEIAGKIRLDYPRLTIKQLAEKYKVTQGYIVKILNNEVWNDPEYILLKNRRRNLITLEQKNEIFRLRKEGKIVKEISRIIGRSTSAINNVLLGRQGKKSKHPLYNIWSGIIRRCYDPNFVGYNEYYGERGIIVCDRWRYSFENFVKDLPPRPSSKHSLE